MHDGASPHTAAYTSQDLLERGIYRISWSAFSPDLNPIEALWNKMKDYIALHHPGLPRGKQRSYEALRGIVQEAWDSIPLDLLERLIDSMPDRCQAVTEAQGSHTKS